MKIKPGAIISNRYEIIEQIGLGGMSIVYKAKDRKLGRIVTFKVLRGEYVKDQEFIKRFTVEARAAASLSHPNIVNVYDVGHDGLVYYIVMEYIDGVTLKEIIKRRAPFSNDEVLGVAVQIASALSHAHNHNIIHRDIKPQNIMVTANGVIKVTDFGIAKAVGAKTITIANNTMGSVHYFSPEQAKGGYVTFKSDIYSLGLVMFEMATGKLPFDGDTPVAIAIKQINEFLPNMKELNPNVSDRLQKIVTRATEKFASRRYDSTEEMENDLKRAITNQVGKDSNEEINIQDSPTIQLTVDDIAKIKKETLPVEDEEDYYNTEYEVDDKDDKKIIMAAVATSFVIIFLISFVGYKMFFNAKPVEVPQLVGKSLEQANEIAKSIGVKIKKVGTEYSSDIEKDKISNQNYSDGDNLYKGDTIDVKISLGASQVPMPDVKNKDLLDAYNTFKNYSFNVDEVYEYSSSVPNNVVISQSPSAGITVDENTDVVLHVSKGQEIKNVLVPNLVGLTESQAKLKLQNEDLIVGSVTKSQSSKYPAGTVITQTVDAGKEVQSGTVVSFVVSSAISNPSPVPTKASPTSTTTIEPNETKILTVDPANIPSDAQTVKLRILKVGTNGAQTFYEDEVSVDKLPMKFNITKENAGEYQIYLIDADNNASYQGSTTISFE